jgi:hypothetical protein
LPAILAVQTDDWVDNPDQDGAEWERGPDGTSTGRGGVAWPVAPGADAWSVGLSNAVPSLAGMGEDGATGFDVEDEFGRSAASRLTVGALFPLLERRLFEGDALERSVVDLSVEPSLLSSHLLSLYLAEYGPRFGACFPMLFKRLDAELPAHLLSVRAVNALRRRSLTTWSAVIGFKFHDFMAVDNFGITSLGSVFGAAAVESVALATGSFDSEIDSAPVATALAGELNQGMVLTPRRVIGDLMPELRRLGLEDVPPGLLPVRLRSHLGRHSWSDLLNVCVEDLLNQRNVGDRSVVELLTRLANQVPAAGRASANEAALGRLDVVLRWAARERAISTVGDFLKIWEGHVPLPPRVAAVWNGVLEAPIEPGESEVGALVPGLLDGYDDRQVTILRSRVWCRTTPSTLEEIGDATGVTRERIRQLHSRLEEELRLTLNTPKLQPVIDRAQELRLRLGSAVRLDSTRYREAVAWATRDLPTELELDGLDLLLWCAGPYREREDWLVALDAGSPSARAKEFMSLAREAGALDREAVQTYLADVGIAEDQRAAWLASFTSVEEIEGVWIDTSGGLVDAAARYLAVHGEPLTTEEILAGLGREASVRSVRQRLFEDDRFHRVTKAHFALAAWGMDEYTTVAGEMAEEIERSGGRLPLDVLIERLLQRHAISPTSVRMYSDRPMFAVDAQGQISLRDLNTYEVDDNLRVVPGCYEHGPRMATWRVKVDSDIRRGSGRRIPEQIAGWLGLRPDERLDMHHGSGTLPFAWAPWTQPSVGSLKTFVDAFGATDGDWIVLSFRKPQSVDVRHVERPDKRNVAYEDLALMVGAPPTDGEHPLHCVAAALGMEFDQDDDALRFRVRGVAESQGDVDLVEMLDAIMFG